MNEITEPTPAPDATPDATPPPSGEPPSSAPPPLNGADALPAAKTSPNPEPLPSEPPPPEWREDWRQAFAGKNDDDLKALNRYKAPDGVWKSYKALRAKFDSGEFTRVRPENANDEQLAEWRKETGVPEKPENYYDGLPEEVKIDEDDKPFIDALFKEMHAADATPEIVRKGLETYYRTQALAIEQQTEADKQQQQTTEDELRAEWGPEYRQNMNHVHETLFDTGIFVEAPEGLKERFFQARFDDGTAFSNDPDVLRWMADVSRVINPDVGHTVTPGQGAGSAQSIDQRIGELEAMSSNTKGEYWTGHNAEQLQAELRQLYEVQERQAARR